MKIQGNFISELVTDYTARNAGFEYNRDYISLSNAAQTPQEIFKQFTVGFEADTESLLRCYKGYQMEKDFKERLKKTCDYQGIYLDEKVEISAFDGLVKGHPDFRIDGWIGDFKSIPFDSHMPARSENVSRKIYFQMQAYLFYSEENKSVLLYESRESGMIREIWITTNENVQRQIDLKYKEAVCMAKNYLSSKK